MKSMYERHIQITHSVDSFDAVSLMFIQMFWKHEVVDTNTGSGVMYEFQMAHHLIKKNKTFLL